MTTLARILAFVLFLAAARPAAAQVFLSSEPHPEFTIAPLFISLSIGKSDETPPRLSIFWSLAVPATTKQGMPPDLTLLLPFAITEGKQQPGAEDDDMAKFVAARNFTVVRQGAVAIVARNRTDMGSGRAPQTIGHAPYVTFARDSAERGRSRSATMIRIPLTPHMTSKDWLVGLDMIARDLVRRKPTSWYEDTLWGPRWIASASFGDLRHQALYPLYFELRNNVVEPGKDFSMLTINLGDADHLRIDSFTPTSANRQPSESRRNTEQVSMPIVGAEGLTPQIVRVVYTYFSGSFEWRPVVIPLLFLALGNATGPLLLPVLKRVGRRAMARVHVGAEPARQKGTVLDAGTIAKIRPGESTYEDVVKTFGPEFEEQQRKHGGDEGRTLTYRGQRLVPQRSWRLGNLSHVKRWDLELHEVDVELENDRVADVHSRVRRAKWVPTQPV
jgi:hypothetical protein